MWQLIRLSKLSQDLQKESTGDPPWRKLLNVLSAPLELEQAREEQDHVPTLVHDWAPTMGARDLAGQLVLRRLFAAVVPDQIVVAVCEVDVLLVEDSCPLERRACSKDKHWPDHVGQLGMAHHAKSGKLCSGSICNPEASLGSIGTGHGHNDSCPRTEH